MLEIGVEYFPAESGLPEEFEVTIGESVAIGLTRSEAELLYFLLGVNLQDIEEEEDDV